MTIPKHSEVPKLGSDTRQNSVLLPDHGVRWARPAQRRGKARLRFSTAAITRGGRSLGRGQAPCGFRRGASFGLRADGRLVFASPPGFRLTSVWLALTISCAPLLGAPGTSPRRREASTGGFSKRASRAQRLFGPSGMAQRASRDSCLAPCAPSWPPVRGRRARTEVACLKHRCNPERPASFSCPLCSRPAVTPAGPLQARTWRGGARPRPRALLAPLPTGGRGAGRATIPVTPHSPLVPQ